jgi:hypothetical protein
MRVSSSPESQGEENGIAQIGNWIFSCLRRHSIVSQLKIVFAAAIAANHLSRTRLQNQSTSIYSKQNAHQSIVILL